MPLEKPKSSPSKRIKARDGKHSLGYFKVKKANITTAARPQEIKHLTNAVPELSSQASNPPPPQCGTTLVASDNDIEMSDYYPEASNSDTRSVAAIPQPSYNASNRKRTLTDNTEKQAISTASKDVKGSTSMRANIASSNNRRKGSKPRFAIFSDSPMVVHEAIKRPVQGVKAAAVSNSTNEEVGEAKTSRAKRTKVTLPVSKQRWTRTIGKHVKIKRRELLHMQVKPARRLLDQPRFIRQVNQVRDRKDRVAAAVKEEIKSFSGILKPELRGFVKGDTFSKNFVAPPDIDTQIAKGLKATAADRDSKEASNVIGEPPDDDDDDDDDDDAKAVKAAQAKLSARRLNTLVVHNGLDRTLPPIHNLADIFEDMVLNGLHDSKRHQLQTFLEYIQGRELRVGTMCSGTECPVLALDLINDGQSLLRASMPKAKSLTCAVLTRLGKPNIPFIHVLSCEIVPYKQAYIQRNFNPQYLFRDVTELPGEKA
jgi:hypothetical protein